MPPAQPSPMLAQWFSAKESQPDALLFFRMGDFFELFFEDAEKAARALDIALTTRGEHAGAPIPMCGVPAANAEPYLARLIRRGFRIAIVEQTETPEQAKARGHRGPLPRAVVRVVTPGTVTEEALLEPDRPSWIAAAWIAAASTGGEEAGLAWLDITTGAFACRAVPARDLAGAIGALDPAELLLAEEQAAEPGFSPWRQRIVALPALRFRPATAERALTEAYQVRTLEGFGAFTPAELGAAGALLDYVRATQAGRLPLLSPLSRESGGTTMAIDAATRRSLELTAGAGGAREGSLLAAVDRTVTAAGARLLAARLGTPSTLPGAITARHDAAGFFLAEAEAREEVRGLLKRAPDMARALGRLGLGRGAARDLAAIRDGLAAAAAVMARLAACTLPRPAVLAGAEAALDPAPALAERLSRALVASPPVKASESGAVAPGFDAALDAARALRDDSRRVVAGLEASYRAATGIAALKLRHTSQLGYFAEVPEAAGLALREAAPPPLPGLAHRQTMAGTMRFITTELA
ncbi:MAG: DNA mismatch repair protein MutS, partial [Rubritepida sp.]|nr:DNA mismatch repair protein MutS [Rubritepida sp.]